ncbi:MAG: ATP-binding protein [Bacteroidota bacterium]
MENIKGEDLKEIPTLANVPADQLDWLLDHATLVEIPTGEYIFKKGDPIDKMQIVLKGSADIKIEQKGDFKLIGTIKEKEITGILPYSRATTATGYAEAKTDCEVLQISKSCLRAMSLLHYELTEALVHKMTSRTRKFTQLNEQQEKMMSLGKLSAGLAHELNNPASAMTRSAKELKKQLGHVPEKFKRLMTMRATTDEVEIINDILFKKIANQGVCSLSLIQRSDLEDDMEEWLDDHGVEDAYNLLETLIDFDFTIEDIEEIYEAANENNFPSAIEWIENVLTTEKLVREIQDAAERISGIVQSVKGYSHMDRAQESQEADIHIGINNTITLLNHKIKQKKIEIHKNFDQAIPHPKIMIGEMNQVWTNLIDNAIDAVDNKGIISITTRAENKYVVVEIADNGTGISEEHLTKIFDPFFTTKAVVSGTGLGLDVTYRIISQHNGRISVDSVKGKTTFTIHLPLN